MCGPALAAALGRSWWAAGILGMIMVCGLLGEWQRRVTLTALIRCSPPSTVIVQGKGSWGPALLVRVGGKPEPGPSPGEVGVR